jgi:hypothetical protein
MYAYFRTRFHESDTVNSPVTWSPKSFRVISRHIESRDSSVGIALGYGLENRGSRVRSPAVAGNFSLHHRVQNGSGPTQPPIQWILGVLFPWG